ncbi:MAG: hypothetical protein QOG62_1740 [Thermoleophilaceae bacterium]|nr:hypothetical protein [Thermoleophilaceae bacterium]
MAHDTADPGTAELLREHPLARSGRLTAIPFPPGTGSPGQRRNAGWRATRAHLIAFTDDDCRPPADWLAYALSAAAAYPCSLIQGATLPDPDERSILLAPHHHSQTITPPTPYAQTCNMVYPREVLEQLGGFREEADLIGEDTDLALRARQAGFEHHGTPEVLTYHCVEEVSLRARMRGAWRWRDLPALVKLQPSLRRDAFPLRLFWKLTHPLLLLGALGVVLATVFNLVFLDLLVPWAVVTSRIAPGTSPRVLPRRLIELPGRLLVDSAEVIALTIGSVRHRTLFL